MVKINNANRKGYVHDKLKGKFENEEPRHAKSIFGSFKIKTLKEIKTYKSLISLQETVSERVKLEGQKAEQEPK